MSQAGFTDPPRVPEGLSVIAFGDVHGRLDKLQALLARIEARAAQRPERRHLVISLGDLVDRGPDSAGVIARMLRGVAGCELVVLRGNHEQILLDFLLGQPDGVNTINLGGLETMASYGLDVSPARLEKMSLGDLRRGFLGVCPPDHRRFLAALPCCKTVGDYFFVHAGVRPGIALEDQDEEDMLWIRDAFFEERRRFAKKIVHGHTPVEAPEFLDNRINLDTGAVFGGRLTAALFEDDRVSLF